MMYVVSDLACIDGSYHVVNAASSKEAAERVLRNLGSNAVDYGGEHVPVRVRVYECQYLDDYVLGVKS